MRTQPSPNDIEKKVDLRIRTIRTLWFAMFVSVGLYCVFTLYFGKSRNVSPNNALSLGLLAVGFLTTLISFPVKSKFLQKAVEEQRVELVQAGYIYALAFAEVAGLLGMFDFFVTGDRYFYLLFVIAACGQILHFPKRQHVLDASFKNPQW